MQQTQFIITFFLLCKGKNSTITKTNIKYHQKKGIPHSATQENDEQYNNKQDVLIPKQKLKK